MSWLWNIKLRLLLGGPILIVLGLVIYFLRGTVLALVLPVIGIVLFIAGLLYRPRQKTGNSTSIGP